MNRIPSTPGMLVFPCHVCRTDLSAEEGQAGQLVRCPSCLTTLRVPAGQADPAMALHAMTSAAAPSPYAPPPPGPYGAPGPYPQGPYAPGPYGGAPYGM